MVILFIQEMKQRWSLEGLIKITEICKSKEWLESSKSRHCKYFFSVIVLLFLFYRVICGSRVRVELSTGMPRRSRFDRPPARRPFVL